MTPSRTRSFALATVAAASGPLNATAPATPSPSYTVTVLPPESTAPQIGVKVTVAKATIPDKYRSDRTTDLKVDVKKGENTVKLNMVKGK